jgi:methionyl-tRNA synthetase
MERMARSEAAGAGLELARAVNGYIDRTEPFRLAKDPDRRDELATILYNCAEGLRITAALLAPFLPERAGLMARRLGCPEQAAAAINAIRADHGQEPIERERLEERTDRLAAEGESAHDAEGHTEQRETTT